MQVQSGRVDHVLVLGRDLDLDLVLVLVLVLVLDRVALPGRLVPAVLARGPA